MRRLRKALPSRREFLAGSVCWALIIAANAAGDLLLRGWSMQRLSVVVPLFLAAGCLAFPLGVTTARLLSLGRGREVAFAAHLICLAGATVLFAAGLYALDYRQYYAQWHEAPFTRHWVFQAIFTSLVASYQFAALGLRLLFPLGFVGLFAAAWLLTRKQPHGITADGH